MAIYSNTGSLPTYLDKKDRKNVVLTKNGIERIINYVDALGDQRSKREMLNPIDNISDTAGVAKAHMVTTSPKSPSTNEEVSVSVYFNQPVSADGELTLALTAPDATSVTTTSDGTVTGAFNTLTFTFTPTQTGDYTIAAQSLAGAGTVTSDNDSAPADVAISAEAVDSTTITVSA